MLSAKVLLLMRSTFFLTDCHRSARERLIFNEGLPVQGKTVILCWKIVADRIKIEYIINIVAAMLCVVGIKF